MLCLARIIYTYSSCCKERAEYFTLMTSTFLEFSIVLCACVCVMKSQGVGDSVFTFSFVLFYYAHRRDGNAFMAVRTPVY